MELNINFVILLVGVIFSIFGATWLTNQQLLKIITSYKDELKTEIKRLDEKIDSFKSEMKADVIRLDQRSERIENRLDKIERQLEQNFQTCLT